jgi:glycerol-1-phosphate dehydrogenase [NAD(P)+]
MKLEEVLARATDTKALKIGDGILHETADLFKSMFPGKRPIVVADVTTYEVAGRDVQQQFINAGLNPDEPYIFNEPHFHAEWKFIEMLDEALRATDAIPVAVGSGTINDLSKLCSAHNSRRYMTVATAASMDGYTAFGASITKDGAKQTFSCPAPLALLADTSIICKAPAAMTASGYADLFAKVPAGADWIISDELGVEPIDEFSFNVVQGGLKTALGDPEALCRGDKTAIHNLIEGLVLGGFAMQAHKSSRPASGADHQFSHLWNMEHHEMADGTVPSHGFQVSIGMLMSTALYTCMLQEDFSKLDVEACVAVWPSLEDAQAEAAKMFEGTDFPTIGVTEVTAKYVDKDGLRRQLTTLRDNWVHISDRLNRQIIPLEEARKMLAAVGAPTEPEQIGISRERLRNSAIRAQKIRRRFTILDIAVRTGKLETWLNKIFG